MIDKIKLYWEQEQVDFTAKDQSPLELLEEIGEVGRSMLLEILYSNYGNELKNHWMKND